MQVPVSFPVSGLQTEAPKQAPVCGNGFRVTLAVVSKQASTGDLLASRMTVSSPQRHALNGSDNKAEKKPLEQENSDVRQRTSQVTPAAPLPPAKSERATQGTVIHAHERQELPVRSNSGAHQATGLQIRNAAEPTSVPTARVAPNVTQSSPNISSDLGSSVQASVPAPSFSDPVCGETLNKTLSGRAEKLEDGTSGTSIHESGPKIVSANSGEGQPSPRIKVDSRVSGEEPASVSSAKSNVRGETAECISSGTAAQQKDSRADSVITDALDGASKIRDELAAPLVDDLPSTQGLPTDGFRSSPYLRVGDQAKEVGATVELVPVTSKEIVSSVQHSQASESAQPSPQLTLESKDGPRTAVTAHSQATSTFRAGAGEKGAPSAVQDGNTVNSKTEAQRIAISVDPSFLPTLSNFATMGTSANAGAQFDGKVTDASKVSNPAKSPNTSASEKDKGGENASEPDGQPSDSRSSQFMQHINTASTPDAGSGMKSAVATMLQSQLQTSPVRSVISESGSGSKDGAQGAQPDAAQRADVPIPSSLSGDAPIAGITAAKLIQTVNQSEMRIGLHSTEFGNVSVRTSISAQQLLAQITVDHSELSRALHAHLPAAEGRLGNESSVRTVIEIHDQNSSLSSGAGDHSRDSQREPVTSPRAKTANFSDNKIELVPAAIATASDGRLDIRA